MATKPTAGRLNQRVAFDCRMTVDDGFGNEVSGDFEERYTCAAEFRPQGASETVVAARLEGRNVFGVYVRSCADARLITTDWRMRDSRQGTIYAIRSVDGVTDPAWVYLTVESGVAA